MLTTTASGSGGRKPSGGEKCSKKDSGHQASSSSSSIPPSGNGSTPKTAVWASKSYPAGTKTYVVNGLGLSPRYRRVAVDEARGWAQVYEILDGDSYEVVAQLPVGPMANPSMPAPAAVNQQMATADAQEALIAQGTGPVSDAYHQNLLQRKWRVIGGLGCLLMIDD
jgi:hypothetical protein